MAVHKITKEPLPSEQHAVSDYPFHTVALDPAGPEWVCATCGKRGTDEADGRRG